MVVCLWRLRFCVINWNINLSFLLIQGWKICKNTVTSWENFHEIIVVLSLETICKRSYSQKLWTVYAWEKFYSEFVQVPSFSVILYIWIPNPVSVLGQNATQIQHPSGESKIVFPEPIELFTPEVSGQQPKCAGGEGFCEYAEDYPQLVVMLTSTVHHNIKLLQI